MADFILTVPDLHVNTIKTEYKEILDYQDTVDDSNGDPQPNPISIKSMIEDRLLNFMKQDIKSHRVQKRRITLNQEVATEVENLF